MLAWLSCTPLGQAAGARGVLDHAQVIEADRLVERIRGGAGQHFLVLRAGADVLADRDHLPQRGDGGFGEAFLPDEDVRFAVADDVRELRWREPEIEGNEDCA